jgi:hypothetical protein
VLIIHIKPHLALLFLIPQGHEFKYVTGHDFGSKLCIPERKASTHLCVIYIRSLPSDELICPGMGRVNKIMKMQNQKYCTIWRVNFDNIFLSRDHDYFNNKSTRATAQPNLADVTG